jgi:ubiquinone/menaquinone biosynthesis C-methylase UbiE
LRVIREYLKQAAGSYLRNTHPHFYYGRRRGKGREGFNLSPDDPIQLKSGKVCNRLKGYRKEVRPFWYRVFDAVRLLDELCSMKMASSSTFQDFEAIYQSDTLPRPVEEYEFWVQKEFQRKPGLFYQEELGNPCSHLRKPLKMIRKELLTSNRYLRQIVSGVYEHGLKFSECELLDVGCGSGALVYGLKMAGAKGVTGLDISLDYPAAYYRDRERALKSSGGFCRFIKGSAEKMGIADASFDVIVSTSVIEHLTDIEKSFQEMYRVLRPGGLGMHFYCPYFGPQGGHSLMTLDFPWGHVCLDRSEILDYLAVVRPYELPRAKQFLLQELPTRPNHLHEIQESIIRAGFQLKRWDEGVRQSHVPWLDKTLWKEVKGLFPRVTLRDLMVNTVWMVLVKPK